MTSSATTVASAVTTAVFVTQYLAKKSQQDIKNKIELESLKKEIQELKKLTEETKHQEDEKVSDIL